MKALLLAILLLSGCGGGGGSPGEPSSVRVMLVDNGFPGTAVGTVLYADPGFAAKSNHGDKLAAELQRYTDAEPVGFVPYAAVSMPLWPASCFTDYVGLTFLPVPFNCSTDSVDIIKGIRWAADNGIEVVNVRWGGCCFDTYYHAAARYAWDKGTLVVWAVGQDQYLLDGPNSPHLFSVGSYHAESNYGPGVDYVAGNKYTSHSAVRVSGQLAELYEELKPTRDAAGADRVLTEFLRRY